MRHIPAGGSWPGGILSERRFCWFWIVDGTCALVAGPSVRNLLLWAASGALSASAASEPISPIDRMVFLLGEMTSASTLARLGPISSKLASRDNTMRDLSLHR